VSRLVTAHRLILGADEMVELTTYRIGQYADASDVAVEAPHLCAFPNGQMS
jgi:hypothetical protein